MDLSTLLATPINPEGVLGVAIGLGLAAAAGFRVFVPLLAAAVAAKAGLLPLARYQVPVTRALEDSEIKAVTVFRVAGG